MSDSLNQLADALYGRAAMPADYIGGSDARIFHDAADRIAFLQTIASRDDDEREIQLQREAQLTQKYQAFRAAVAAALAELRASLEETSDTFDSGLESWPYDDCRIRLEKVIAGLGLVVHEDQLPKTLTDSQYNEWFTKFSWLQDGVRVGLPIAALNLTHKEERENG